MIKTIVDWIRLVLVLQYFSSFISYYFGTPGASIYVVTPKYVLWQEVKTQMNCYITSADPEGGQGVRTPPPLKNHKNIGFSSSTGPDPFKIAAAKPVFNVGPSSARQRNAIAGGPMMSRL